MRFIIFCLFTHEKRTLTVKMQSILVESENRGGEREVEAHRRRDRRREEQAARQDEEARRRQDLARRSETRRNRDTVFDLLRLAYQKVSWHRRRLCCCCRR
jgi:hypothetical protein